MCEPVAPEWDNNVLGDLTSYPFLCSTHVHCHCAQEVQTLTQGPRILIVLLILKFNYQVFIVTPYPLLCSAHAPNKYHTTHTRTHTKPQRLPSLMALVVLHICYLLTHLIPTCELRACAQQVPCSYSHSYSTSAIYLFLLLSCDLHT